MYLSPDIDANTELRKSRILIVDDEPTLRFGFAYALTDKDTVADTAAGGQEALSRLEGSDYDAVVLDLRMPEVDGLAVIENMRAKGDFTPVILCSAFMTLHSALMAIRNQVVDFLMKPVKPADLRIAVSLALGGDTSPLAEALAAVRAADLDKAISILRENGAGHGDSETAWLKLLTTFQRLGCNVQATEFELDASLLDHLVVKARH